MKLRVTRGRSK